jgi:hypothetical protein
VTLEHLDVLIAFAVVMLGVSLLITVLTQMIGSLLGLRGHNLRRALVDLIGTAHPTLSEHASDIARRVLQHPLVSDSAVQWYADLVEYRPRYKWPLAGLGGLAAGLIIWGSTRSVVPEASLLNLYVGFAVTVIVGLALVWLPGRWTLATALRVEELIGVLEKLSDGVALPVAPPASPQLPLPAGWTMAHSMAYIAQAARAATSPEIQALATQVQKSVGAVPVGPAIPAGAAAPQPSLSVALDKVIQQIPTTVESKLDDLKSWFSSAMDRAKQRFTMQTRLVTVAVSMIVAFGMHFDAPRLLKQLSTDTQLRTSLVNGASAMAKRAEKILPASKPQGHTNNPPKPDAAVAGAVKGPKDVPSPATALEQAGAETGQASAAVRPLPEVYAESATETVAALQSESKSKTGSKLEPASAFACREEALEWLQSKGVADASSEFNKRVDARLETESSKLLDQAASIKCQLSHSGFQLVPTPYPSWNFKNDNVFGILAAAALLGLGAPFWYNALKTMSSLRPLVAGKQEQEQKEKPRN